MKFFVYCLILAYFCAVVFGATTVRRNNGKVGKRSADPANVLMNRAERYIAQHGKTRRLVRKSEGSGRLDSNRSLWTTLTRPLSSTWNALTGNTTSSGGQVPRSPEETAPQPPESRAPEPLVGQASEPTEEEIIQYLLNEYL